MRILITGSNGFIGSSLVLRLSVVGHQVFAGVRPGGDRSRLMNMDNITTVECDVEDLSSIDDAIAEARPDKVIHLATRYAVQHQSQDATRIAMANVVGTINLLESIKGHGNIDLINTSSCFVYAPKDAPLVETDPLSPFNFYALTKLQAEEACSYYARQYGTRIVNLRLFPPYGPGDYDRKLIPSFIKAVLSGSAPQLTNGRQKWDYIHIHDVLDAYEKVIEHFDDIVSEKVETYNIGTGQATSVRSIGETILEIMGSNIEPHYGALPERTGELFYLCSDINKVQNKLHWAPRISIHEGLASSIEWYKARSER
ncbi:MAG: NAD(P)-dependent oxidoreductase [Methanomassiliicoccus sp.]|nr:NAD(P)-dependent oxidoreductase [Methanomassiliicoccus sp.]